MVPETFIEGCRAHLEALARHLQEQRERLTSCVGALDARQCAGRLLVHFVYCRILEAARCEQHSQASLPFDPEAVFPPHILCALSEFLDTYHYIMDESDGGAVSPASLSMLHELSLGPKNALGAYYTPEPVVQFMCRESLLAYLVTGLSTVQAEAVRAYVASSDRTCLHELDLASVVRERLLRLRVCDPAVGAGAFSMGMMREFCRCLCPLMPEMSEADVRRHFFERCFFGCDVDLDAIEVARLRCMLAVLAVSGACGNVPDLSETFRHGDALRRSGDGAIRELEDGAFDIVIGNPPYGIKISPHDRAHYKKNYVWLNSRYDIYMLFFERGFSLTRDVLCYITPDKWLSKSFGLIFREQCMVPYMRRIVRLGNGVFGTALVDAVVSLFARSAQQFLTVVRCEGSLQCQRCRMLDKSALAAPFIIDEYFHEEAPVISQLERQTHRLREFASCEYAFANPKAAYALVPILHQGAQDKPYLRVINTGLIGKYSPLWSHKTMRYLRQRYDRATVSVEDLRTVFSEPCACRMLRPKLVLKGLSRLDCCVDLDGCYFSTVATLHVTADDVQILKVLAAILNAPASQAYLRAKYSSSSYCGGLLFTPEMIGSLPVPDLSDMSVWRDVLDAVDEVLTADICREDKCQKIAALVEAHYGI